MLKNVKSFSSFSVDDLDKAKEFYGQKLGIEISDAMGGNINLNMAGNKVLVYSKPNHVPATFTVLNFMVDDAEKTVDELTGLGIKFEIYSEGQMKTDAKGIAKMGESGQIAWFKDPAGNFLSVIEAK
jgi:predicted enzyme related to lactoylglutathione lyase